MGCSPIWYKKSVLAALILNPLILLLAGDFTTGWIILIEFILTLALALKCYPLLPGGLLAIEVIFMGLVSPDRIYSEVEHNLEVILLLMFMVAGIHFMKDFLSWIFTKLLFSTRSKIILSLMFSFAGAFLSAWLDALTVMAVMIAVAISFYDIYNDAPYYERVPKNYLTLNSEVEITEQHLEDERKKLGKEDLKNFNGFLRNLLMHGAVGTALGGVSTIVGEPQNLLIGSLMGWSFVDFWLMMAHVSIPVLISGFITVIFVEKFKVFGYGYQLPERIRNVLKKDSDEKLLKMDSNDYFKLYAQAFGALWLITGLALHLASVGLIGLSVIILLTVLTGKDEEQQIGKAFEEALPFTALIVVFFAIVGMIQSTELFKPIIDLALSQKGNSQLYSFFIASGVLSAISDNVFVATIYIKEAVLAFQKNLISREQLDLLAIAINVGTNIPSVATPNGQAAFLFLLTSTIAARIKLSYMTMLKMAFPYTVVLCLISISFIAFDWIPHQPLKHTEIKFLKEAK